MADLSPEELAWKRQNDRVRDRIEGGYGPYTNGDWADVNTLWHCIERLAAENAELWKMWWERRGSRPAGREGGPR